MSEESSVRRSARATKGQNSRLDESRRLEEELISKRKSPAPKTSTPTKKQKTDDQEHSSNGLEEEEVVEPEKQDEDEGVRCLPCGANNDNYDEDTDKLGFMVLCESCKTWQHGKCMGYTKKKVPKVYKCNVCVPELYPNLDKDGKSIKNEEKETIQSVPTYSISSLKDKARARVATIFQQKFEAGIPDDYEYMEDFDKVKLSTKWALELEKELHDHFPTKYSEKARSLTINLAKPFLINKVVQQEVTVQQLASLSPEQMSEDLQKLAESVRRESIRQSVLKVEDQPRIRRTHKGEEIVEDTGEFNNNDDSRNRLNEESRERSNKQDNDRETSVREIASREKTPENHIKSYANQSNFINQDLQDDYIPDNRDEASEDNHPVAELDDDFDMILNGDDNNKNSFVQVPESQQDDEYDPGEGLDMSEDETVELGPFVWEGQISFPGLASFEAKHYYLGSSSTNNTNDRLLTLSKNVIKTGFIEIEGRLGNEKADPYLSKIAETRDLLLAEVKPGEGLENKSNFTRMFEYFLGKRKYGVLGDRPSYVKDAYLIPVAKGKALPSYFDGIHLNSGYSLSGEDRIIGLFVVKKDYMPGRSMTVTPPATAPSSQQQAVEQPYVADVPYYNAAPTNNNYLPPAGEPANLSTNDLVILQNIVQQHPEVSQNPALLFELLRQQQR